MGSVKVSKPNRASEHEIADFSTPNGGVSGSVTFKESVVWQGLLAAFGEGDIPDFDPSIKIKSGIAAISGISGISISSEPDLNNFDFTHTFSLAGVNGASKQLKIVTNNDGQFISVVNETGIRVINGVHATFLGVPVGPVGDIHAGIIIDSNGAYDLTGGVSVDVGLVFGNLNSSLDVSGSGPLLDIKELDFNGGCFLAGTAISMWDGTKKPIEEIIPKDEVVSYDKNGNVVPGKGTRVFLNQAKHVLDVFGLHVTPGHVTFCGDGEFEGRHVPIIDVLRSNGSLVREDDTKIRACTNEVVGSAKDALIWAITGERQPDGSIHVRQRGQIRLGTRYITDEGYEISVAELVASAGATVSQEGLVVSRFGGAGVPFLWPFGAVLPKPEDYVLQRSAVLLSDIYRNGEWEGVPPQMRAPVAAGSVNAQSPNEAILDAMPPGAPKSMQESASEPLMNRRQRKAHAAKLRKRARQVRDQTALH